MIKNIRSEGNSYFSAIVMSVQTASDGQTLAADALDLCQFLTNQHPPEQLKAFLRSMLQNAADSHRRALETVERFRSIRRNIFIISQKIPSDLDEIKAEQLHSETGDIYFITLPTPLSKGDLDHVGMRNAEKRSSTHVVGQLEQAQSDLDQLAEHVGRFADWWKVMETGLDGLLKVIPQMQRDGSNILRMESIRKRWEKIEKSYISYSRQISFIQDFHSKVGNHELPSRQSPNIDQRQSPKAPLSPPIDPPRSSDPGHPPSIYNPSRTSSG